jgi:hypothetical protein
MKEPKKVIRIGFDDEGREYRVAAGYGEATVADLLRDRFAS